MKFACYNDFNGDAEQIRLAKRSVWQTILTQSNLASWNTEGG